MMKLSLYLSTSTKLSSSSSHVISIQELFTADLRTLVSIQNELEAASSSPTPLQPNGPRKRESVPVAFRDKWLKMLVSDHSGAEPNGADIKVMIRGERAVADFLADISPTTFDTREEKGVEGFVRDKSSDSLLKNVLWVKDTAVSLLNDIVAHQEAYLVTNDVTKLRPCTLSDLAKKAHLHLTTVSRLISKRTFISPDGYLMPVNSLLVTQEKIDQLTFFKWITREYPTLTDLPSSTRLQESAKLPLSDRTVRKYLTQLLNRKNAVENRRTRERQTEFPDLSTLIE